MHFESYEFVPLGLSLMAQAVGKVKATKVLEVGKIMAP